MLLNYEQIQIEALSLPPVQRAELVDRLLASLCSQSDAIEREWLETARCRLEDVQQGRIEAVDGGEVMQRARKLVGP